MANKRIAIICGHGAGDPGAVGNGYQEADVVRDFGTDLVAKLKPSVSTYLYDQKKNFYKSKEWSLFSTNDEIIELHLNSFSSTSAKGTEVLIKDGYSADPFDTAILNALVKYFTDRGIKKRSDLGNMNGFASRKIGYRLVEICFVSNSEDMKILKNKWNNIIADLATAIIKASGGKVSNSSSTAGFTKILGSATATEAQMTAYLKSLNPKATAAMLALPAIYLKQGKTEGVRGDIAFAQSCLETGNFTFVGSAVTFDQNNFCGLGVTSTGLKGESFKTASKGVLAQIQHLKAYATTASLNTTCVDPRYKYVDPKGCAEYVEWLGQKENPKGKGWATGAGYGEKVLGILKKITAAKDESTSSGSTSSSSKNTITVKVTTSDLNIRNGAGSSNKVVGHIKDKGTYTIVEVKNNWGKLKSGAGWICLDYTDYSGGSSPAGFPYTVKITADVLNVRKGAGIGYEVSMTVKKNEIYTITEEKSGWGKLKSGAGWISLEYTMKA